MAAKHRGKKSRVPKTSIAKLTNKRLNKLAKQGKLKKSLGKKRLVDLLKYRTNKPVNDRDGSPEDIPVEEADYDYFSRPGRDFSFLSELDPSKKKKTTKRKRENDKSSNIEQMYEKQLKTAGTDKNVEVKSLLPFKSKEKGIIHRTIEIQQNKEEEDPTVNVGGAPDKPFSAIEEVVEEELRKKDAKKHIKLLASNLLQNPQEHVSDLKSLLSYVGNSDAELPVNVRKCAIVALTDVFRDVIPGYRIRALTDAERKQSMKKVKKEIFTFEETLLNYYHQFLELMKFLATGKKQQSKKKEGSDAKMKKRAITPVNKGLRLLCIGSLCSLLVTHPHFNFRTEIISVVLRFITSSNAELSDTVCEAVKQLFKDDKSGEVSLEVVRLIGRIIKVKMFKVKPKVLDTFLSIRIKQVEKPEDKEKSQKLTKEDKMKKFSKRERKRHKAMEHLEKELREAAAEEDVKHKLKVHTQVINSVFLTYFRILKLARHSNLLGSVLEGLAKFAHLINVSFFDDLFAVMTELVLSGDLSNRCSLNCVQTASTLLMGQGEALNIDPVRFYNHLYKVLLQLHVGNSTKDLQIALNCLDVLVDKRRRHVSEQRTLAFLKRVATVSLQMSSDGALALLGVIRKIIIECPKSDVLLSSDTIGCGVFLPELDEPDYCNACNTSLFELHLLRKSYHPAVRNSATILLHGPSKQ